MAKGTGLGKAFPKNFRKVKSGYDQAFTLPKGTSAAPINQSKVTGTTTSMIEGAVIGGASVGGWELGKKTSKKMKAGQPGTGSAAKPITKKGWGRAYKRGG